MKTGTKPKRVLKKELKKKLRHKRIVKHFNVHGDTSLSSRKAVLKKAIKNMEKKLLEREETKVTEISSSKPKDKNET